MTPKLLSDEELATALGAVRSDVDHVAREAASGESREDDLDAICGHIDAQAAQIAELAEQFQSVLDNVHALTAQRERYREMVVALTSERCWDDDDPRTIAPEADRTLDALLGFEVRT